MLSEVRPRRNKTKGPGPLGEPVKWFGLTQGLPRGYFSGVSMLPRQWDEDDIEEMRRMYVYDPESGQFYHRVTELRRKSHVIAGDVAGSTCYGYRTLKYHKKKTSMQAHRVAWMFVHGVLHGNDQIDHINGNRMDNRLCNLRRVPAYINGENVRKCRARNKVGLLGVHRDGRSGKYVAQIQVRGKRIPIGRMYETPEDAHAAYIQAKRLHHIGCTI